MAFRFTDQHRIDYFTVGFTVLRGVIPPALLADLRCEADKAQEIARSKHGAQVQRLQPVYAYDALDARPFRDFHALPGMRATVEGILGPGYQPTENMGILLEPAERPWCTHWHRDWGYNAPHVDIDVFFESIKDLRLFNQLNGALYDDHSLWVIPDSHAREDTPEERAVFPVVPPPWPALSESMSDPERERTCLEYAMQMPGAMPVPLFAGDVAFYRSSQWHLGNYVPYARRATLHDGYYCEGDYAWQARVRQWQEAARAQA